MPTTLAVLGGCVLTIAGSYVALPIAEALARAGTRISRQRELV